ncbi:2-dehydropantoate 2-reductase [Actinomadura rugatobispora]|uniref:2-dehydropantoate 2-reductase n=1 Tax=Actinomadura rugatobispora TaxID=1994 RepID=A0ABW1A5F9_9ACTN|nr:oxidoreductase [Actinomadura rugatobispora]
MARIAVIGPGAVGSVFAALVSEQKDHDLVVCARSVPPDKIVVESESGTRVCIPDAILADPAEVGEPVDWVFLAIKAHDTAGAARWLAGLCDERTTVVVLQNGIGHQARVAPHAPTSVVLPAIVWCPSEVVGDGRVSLRGPVRVGVPDSPAGSDLIDLLDPTEARVELVADFTTHAWRKICANVVAGLMVLTERRAEVFSLAGMRALAHQLACESASVGKAEGARLDVRAVADAIIAELVSMPSDMGTSMLFDRLAGRPTEWREIHGVVQELGKSHGISTPALDVIVPLLQATSGRQEQG